MGEVLFRKAASKNSYSRHYVERERGRMPRTVSRVRTDKRWTKTDVLLPKVDCKRSTRQSSELAIPALVDR